MSKLAKRQIDFKEQELLFSDDNLLPESLPRLHELHPSHNLSAVFDTCHNYIYANEGMLKDKIFHEMVKLLVMKLHDEQNALEGMLQFGITSDEYKSLLMNLPNLFEQRINTLYDKVRSKYNGFFSDDSLKLKKLTLAYIINRLQFISLTRTSGDIKGEAFQAFTYRHQRGDRGEFFTPYPIVKLAVEMIAPKPNERVIDPACGSGGFLIQAINHIQRRNPNIDKTSYLKACIRGIEFNPDVALAAMIRLAFEGGSGTEISCANALADKVELDNSFDIVLTNPPFGSRGKIEDQKILKSYLLARRWLKTENSSWEATKNVLTGQSPEILFIEKCLRLLRPSGRMAIVLPDGLLQNISNSHIRFWIRSQAKILGVVSIPQEAFVPYGTGIKTSLLLLQKFPATATDVFMAQIKKIGYDVKGQPIYKRDDYGKLVKTSSGIGVVDEDIDEIISAYHKLRDGEFRFQNDKIFTVPEPQLNSRFDAEHYQPADQSLTEQLEKIGSKSLGEIAEIINEADDFRLASDEEIRYIAISDVDARTMQVVSQQKIRAHEAPSRATYRVRKGDIITAISGASTGTIRQATALITDEEDGAICSNGFAVLRNIQGIHPLFLLAFMRTEYYLRQVRRLMTGHAIPAISTEDLSKVLVPITPREEQEKIANDIATTQALTKKAMKISDHVISQTKELISEIM